VTEVLSDRYELGVPLGSGGMASVVAARDRLLDRPVAIKLLREDLAGDEAVRARFLAEARAAAGLSHPNVVAVYDVGVDAARPFIVMERVDGPTLAAHLRSTGPLPEAEVEALADAILAGLQVAHRRGLVHRDVKPGNVLLPADGGAKLADFGIAKSLDATVGLTAAGEVLGTPRYLAPELLAGDPASHASDVYAVGVLLYELLTGGPPFDGPSPMSVALAHQRDPVPPVAATRPDVDPALQALVDRALAKDPADRFPDATVMRAALRDVTNATAATTTVLTATPTPDPAATSVTATAVLPASAPVPAPSGIAAQWGPQARTGRLLVGVTALAALLVLGYAVVTGAGDPGDLPAVLGEVPTPAAAAEPEPAPAPPPEPLPEPDPVPPQLPRLAGPEPPPGPATLDELILLMQDDPARFGRRGKKLHEELEKLAGREGVRRAERAAELLTDVDKWDERGELDPDLAQQARAVLTAEAAAAGDDDDDDDD
jgi:eukaryotic-like serine/threonine-protein kinase